MNSYPILNPSGAKAMLLLRNYALSLLALPTICAALWLAGVISMPAALFLIGLFLYIIINLLWRFLYYRKIVFSKISFFDKGIEVTDQKENIWKSFRYSEITKIKVMEINGMMYGFSGLFLRGKFIVIFFNHCEILPTNSFKDKFKSDDYFPILYREEIWDLLREKMERTIGETGSSSTS